jgi:hypothetical protein
MTSFEQDGKYYAAPTIVNVNGKLKELKGKDAIDYAMKNKEYAQFDSKENAEKYANGSWKTGDMAGAQYPKRQLTAEEKAKILIGLPESDVTKYKNIESLTNKEEQKVVGKQVFQTDASGNIDFTKPPLYTEPEKPVKPSPRILNMPGYDKKTNSFLQKEGIPIDESEKDQYPETMKVGNQLFGVTKTASHGKPLKVIDQNGKREKEYTRDMHVLNQSYFNTQQKYQRALQTGYKSNGQPVTPEERDSFKQVVNEWNKKYVEHVKATMPKAATKWYQDLYNIKVDGKTGNKNPDEYLKTLHKDFIDGKFKGVDEKVIMRSLHELYRATYSQDPTGQDYSEAVPEEPEAMPDSNPNADND